MAKFKVGDKVRYTPDDRYKEMLPHITITKIDGCYHYFKRTDNGKESSFSNLTVFEKIPCNSWKERFE